MKILIVDDDEVARISLSGLLRPLGAELVLAGDGEEAWALIEGGLRPSLCCSDVLMPGMDGLALLERMRAHPVLRDLPFILISAAADRATVQKAVAAGVAGYVLKPFLAVQTRCTVDRVLREHQATLSEHFLVTRRRLDLDLDALEKVLLRLRDDVQTCAAALQAASDHDVGAAPLQRLHSAAVLLGLYRGAELLREAMEPQTAPEARLLAVREVSHLVSDQLLALRRLEAGTAPRER